MYDWGWNGLCCERWEERLVLARREGQSEHGASFTHTHKLSLLLMRTHAGMRRQSCVLRLRQKRRGADERTARLLSEFHVVFLSPS